MTYPQHEIEFLETIATEFGLAGKRYSIFIERFKEANADLNDAQIADILNLEPNQFNPSQVRDHLKVICDQFAAAGCDCGTDGKGRWKHAKKWLRFERYPQWQQQHQPQPNLPLHPEYIWHSLREKAQPQTQWIEFVEPQKSKAALPKDLKVPPTQRKPLLSLQADTKYSIYLDLRFPQEYLLLLNQGKSMRYIVSPSTAFVPNPRLSGNPLWIPQTGATESQMEFDGAGREEFLAVVLPQPLDLPWLEPNDTEAAPECDVVRLQELWEQLQQQKDYRVFHREFQVV